MNKRILIIMLVLSVGINLGFLGTLAYHELREGRPDHRIPPLPHWLNSVEGMTPEQMEKIHTIMKEDKENFEATRDEMIQKRSELTKLLMADKPDMAAINQKIAEISQVQVRMELLIADKIIAIRSILTPDQQKMLFDQMGKFIAPPPPDGPPPSDRPHGDNMMRDRGMDRGGWGWGRSDNER